MTIAGPRSHGSLSQTSPPTFVRAIATPPALPWEQARMAKLEARRSSPLQLPGLTVQVKRLKAWRPGTPGAFGAIYVRTEDIATGFTAIASLDGVAFRARFEPRRKVGARVSRIAIIVATTMGAVASAMVAVFAALSIRAEDEANLGRLETAAKAGQRRALEELQRRRRSTQIEDLPDRGQPAGNVLADLAWASANRNPDTPFEAFHWRMDGMGVEVRGEAQPFASGQAVRASRQVRPGVWLWIPNTEGGR